MPTESTAAVIGPSGAAAYPAARRILRLAFGTALALWFSQIVGWSLSFVAPVITLILLATPKPAPGLKGGLVVMVLLALTAHAGLVLLPLLLHQTAAGILILAVLLFQVFYFTARGGNPILGTLMTVGLTMTIAVGSVSVDAVLAAAQSISASAVVGVAFVWIAHALVPDLPTKEVGAQTPTEAAPNPQWVLRDAVRSFVIVFPVAVFLLFSPDSAGYIAVMLKVSSMTQQVTARGAREAGEALLLSTLIGGVAALAGWMILAVWPMLLLFCLFVALAGLMLGRHIFSGAGLNDNASTWSYAYLTMIVILAPAVTDSLTGSSAGVAFASRLLMFVCATAYGVAAVYIADAFLPRQREAPNSA